MDPAHGVFYLREGWDGNYQISAGWGAGTNEEAGVQESQRWLLRRLQGGWGWQGVLAEVNPPCPSPPRSSFSSLLSLICVSKCWIKIVLHFSNRKWDSAGIQSSAETKSSFANHTGIRCPRIDRRGKPCKVRLHQTSQFRVFCLEGSAESLGTCKAGTGIREFNKNAARLHISRVWSRLQLGSLVPVLQYYFQVLPI